MGMEASCGDMGRPFADTGNSVFSTPDSGMFPQYRPGLGRDDCSLAADDVFRQNRFVNKFWADLL